MQKIFLITIIAIVVIIIIILGIYFFMVNSHSSAVAPVSENTSNSNNSSNMMIQGMKLEIAKEGSGAEAKKGDIVTVNYTGTLTDGTKFDSSLNPGRTPFQLTLGENRVIQGWELGVLGMKAGEKRKLTIPPELAYGSNGVGFGGKFGCVGQENCDPNKETYIIPSNATLIFEIEMLKIGE